MRHVKTILLGGVVAFTAIACGPPPEGETNEPSQLTEQQQAKQDDLGVQKQAVGACGAWQADMDPQLTVNTSSYSNGANEGTGNSCAGSGTYGSKYQCVELAQRYYAVRWGFPNIWSGVAAARDMCNNHPSGVQTFDLPGSGSIWHGDLAVFGAGTFGHVAVIDKDNGNGSFNVVEQNAGTGGRSTRWRSATLCGLWTASNTGPH